MVCSSYLEHSWGLWFRCTGSESVALFKSWLNYQKTWTCKQSDWRLLFVLECWFHVCLIPSFFYITKWIKKRSTFDLPKRKTLDPLEVLQQQPSLCLFTWPTTIVHLLQWVEIKPAIVAVWWQDLWSHQVGLSQRIHLSWILAVLMIKLLICSPEVPH